MAPLRLIYLSEVSYLLRTGAVLNRVQHPVENRIQEQRYAFINRMKGEFVPGSGHGLAVPLLDRLILFQQ